jgi:ribulose-phosphate 3-epimerase
LSADFARLAEQVRAVEQAGATMLHVDVMDGHFVPNITIGPPVVKSLRKATGLTLDVHLMIENPDQYIPAFADAGADWISVHQEASRHLHRTLELIKSVGARAGAVVNPGTPVETLLEVLDMVDFVLVMSVNPGFGGQKFIAGSLQKMKTLAALRSQRGLRFQIEVDGGISQETVADAVRAGAEVLVAGNAIFGHGEAKQNFADLRSAAERALSTAEAAAVRGMNRA